MRSFSTELTELVAYFNLTYVSGQVHSIHRPDGDLRERLRRSAPMFPRPVWNVIIIIIRAFVRRTMSASELNLRRRMLMRN